MAQGRHSILLAGRCYRTEEPRYYATCWASFRPASAWLQHMSGKKRIHCDSVNSGLGTLARCKRPARAHGPRAGPTPASVQLATCIWPPARVQVPNEGLATSGLPSTRTAGELGPRGMKPTSPRAGLRARRQIDLRARHHLLHALVRGEGDAQDGADHFPVHDDLLHAAPQLVDGDCEPHPAVAPRRAVDRCVHACVVHSRLWPSRMWSPKGCEAAPRPRAAFHVTHVEGRAEQA